MSTSRHPSQAPLTTGIVLGSLVDATPAVVTGGGSGIGTMFASAYVHNGAKVYIASRKEKQLKEVRRRRTSQYRVWNGNAR